MGHSRISLASLAALLALTGCGDVFHPDQALLDSAGMVTQVIVEPAAPALLFVDDSLPLRARAVNPWGYDLPAREALWGVADSTVARVSADGVVRAAGPGTVVVTATIRGTIGTASLTVDPGIVLPNACTRCHWVRRPGGHFAWAFAQPACDACHDFSEEGHGVAMREHRLATGFPLAGAHAMLDCGSCHVQGAAEPPTNPAGPADCIACHATAYASRHAATGFPTTCATCHTTVAWTGASFDHDRSYFPIFTGEHQGRWASCGTCHSNPDDFGVFSCFACHSQSETASDHREVTGFRYESSECYRCHPRGTS